jgi:hypothetical protein
MAKITNKFQTDLVIKFKDEDGTMVMLDDDDALDDALLSSSRGRLELWCDNV